jgi:RHS repeat-associated protein
MTTSFGYDRAGNRTSVTNRRNQAVSFTHDALGRVNTRTTPDAGVTSYGYSPFSEPLHQWISAQNAEGADTLVYKQGRLHDQVTWLNGGRYLVHSRYIGDSETRDQIRVTSPFSRIIKYGYDNQMRLGSLTDMAGGTTTLGYNGDRQVSGVWLPNGISRSFTYDFTHRVKGLGFAGVASEKLAESYMYDGMGRMVQRMNNAGDTPHLYGYDAAGQLTSDQMQVKVDAGVQCEDPLRPDSCHPTTAWQNGALAQYAYDPAGNRGQADTGNRLTAFDGYSFTHDAEGNIVRKLKGGVDDVTMTWNSLGRMTGAWRYQRGSVTYGYNGFGQRVRRTTEDGTVTRYLYDGDDLLMELDGAGNPIREYTYYPGVDQPHSVRSWPNGGATYYYATDAVGHVTGLLNGSGQVVNRYTYTPWGEVVSAHETITQPLGYMARESDPVTGLYYVRARWYDAHLGRFVSEDPIGLAGGLNVYAYAANSPTNFTDPSGLCVDFASATDKQHTQVKKGKDEYCPVALDAIEVSSESGGGGGYALSFVGATGAGTSTGGTSAGANPGLPNLPGYEPRERRQAICNKQRALFATNVVFDVAALGTAGMALWAGKPILRAAGVGLYARVVGPTVGGALRPGPIPAVVSLASGALDHGDIFNTRDVFMSVVSLAPGVGSYMAWNSMREACKGL